MSVIDHNHPKYVKKWGNGTVKHNGAYYYSREIVKYIIPNVETNRNWVTILLEGECMDNSIVFIHNNLHPERYEWMKRYKNLILVCGVPETVDKVKHIGTAIYLPLSVKVDEVEKYKVAEHDKEACVAGRKSKIRNALPPESCDLLGTMPRKELLQKMAHYKRVYAVGRTAIEAKILGCEVLPYDPRFPDPSIWKIVDSLEAAKMLQEKIDEIDGK